MPRNFSGAVVGSLGSVQSQIVPYSSLYLFSRSIGDPQMSPVLNAGFLIFCTCYFQSSFPFFLYFCFLCLQDSSGSNFCPDARGQRVATYLGSLVQLSCFWGGILPANTTGMCGERSQWMDHTGFATAQGGMCFPGLPCSVSRVLCNGTLPSKP